MGIRIEAAQRLTAGEHEMQLTRDAHDASEHAKKNPSYETHKNAMEKHKKASDANKKIGNTSVSEVHDSEARKHAGKLRN